MADVSLIIPVYNRRQMVLEAVRSALEQTAPAREILIVDDGSTDDSAAAVAKTYGKEVSLLRQPRRGVSAARNRGIAQARQPWLAFLDSDDLWRPDKLEKQLAALQRESHFDVCHTDELWLRRGRKVNQKKKHLKKGGDLFAYSLPFCRISPSAILLHRRVLDKVGTFDESLLVAEDYDLWLRLTAHFPVLHLAEALTIKRGGHPGQLSKEAWGLDRFRLIALEKMAAAKDLSTEQRRQVLEEIVSKYRILALGANKRGQDRAAAFYRQRADRAQARLQEVADG